MLSKTRLAPKKDICFPRLGLLAAVIDTRCLAFVERELKLEIAEKHVWSDSKCVLVWIDSDKTLPTFVKTQ